MSLTFLLAIESSGRSASVAVVAVTPDGDLQPVSGEALDPAERTAKALIPAIDKALSDAGVAARGLAAVAVAAGPGSFTGLRIGITAAKTIAYATGAQLVGINTLDVLAWQSGLPEGRRVWGVLDAQRGDLFVANYVAADRQTLGEADRTQLVASNDWIASLAAGDLVIGPAAQRYADRLPSGVELASGDLCTPQAGTVATIGYDMLRRQIAADPFQLVPRYHRLSAAEEKARRG